MCVLQHAYTLELLKNHLIGEAKVLDVSSGPAYLTACMAHMVGETGRVIGLDCKPELVSLGINNICNDNPHFLTSGRVKLTGIYKLTSLCPRL